MLCKNKFSATRPASQRPLGTARCVLGAAMKKIEARKRGTKMMKITSIHGRKSVLNRGGHLDKRVLASSLILNKI